MRGDSPKYSVHPSVAMERNWAEGLKKTTGRTVEEWTALVASSGPAASRDRVAWLKAEHSMGANAARWLVDRLEGKGAEMESPEAYLRAAEVWVEALFAGPKTALRPIYDDLLRLAFALGEEVKACPCRTMVPLYRTHVFAQLKPSTNTRLDLGLALGAMPASGRLIDTGGYLKKDRITHRIAIACPSEIDDEVKRWLWAAYEADKAKR